MPKSGGGDGADIDPTDVLGAVAIPSSTVAVSSLPIEELAALRAKMTSSNFLCGHAVSASPPLLGFVLRDHERRDVAAPRAVQFLPWVWPGTFGTSLTITMYRRDADPGMHARVIVPRSDSLARDLLTQTRFIAVMFRDGEPRQAFDVPLPPGRANHSLATHLAHLGTSTAENSDNDAHSWESCIAWKEHLEPTGRLSLSWSQGYSKVVDSLDFFFGSVNRIEIQAASDAAPELLRCVFNDITKEGAVRAARRLFSAAVKHGLPTLVRELEVLARINSDMCLYAQALLDLSMWTSEATAQGTRLPWWDNHTDSLRHIALNGDLLRRRGALDDYWQRLLIYDSFHTDWGRVLDESSVPCKPASLLDTFAELVALTKAEEIDADLHLADLRPETLPLPGPLTKQRIGGFISHRAFWAGGDIAAVAHTRDGEFFMFATAKGLPVQIKWFGFALAGVSSFLDASATREAGIQEIDRALRAPFIKAAHALLVAGDLPLLDLSTWTAAPIQMEIERAKSKQHTLTQWHNNSELRPSDLYAYLKSRFGEPNGMMTLLRHDTSDNIFHWQYNVRVNDDLLCIIASSSGVVFRAITSKAVTRGHQWEIVKRIKADFATHGVSMSKIRGTLEPWALLVNPYQRLVRLTNSLERDLDKEAATEPTPQTIESTEAEKTAYLKSLRAWADAQARTSSICFSIESYTPIVCEAFVNLVLFTLARPEIRDDEVLYQAIIRQGLDLRVRGLHVNCIGFERAVDCTDGRYLRFLKMREKRNLLLHGNLDPKLMIIDRLYFDGKVPIFHTEGSIAHRRIRANASLSDPNSAKQAIRDVAAFVDLVLSAMVPQIRQQVVLISGQDEIGYREDTGRLGILFGRMAGIAFDYPDGLVVPPAKSDQDEQK